MPQYDFRLEFRLPSGDHINADAEELPVLNDSSGVTIRLRSGPPGNPIKDHSCACLIGGPYPSEAEARNVAERARRALLLWAVGNRVGIDLGGRQQIGAPLRAGVDGIDVYEHADCLFLVRANMQSEASVGKSAQAFVEQVAGAISKPVPMTEKQELAAEILSASYFEASDRSRFITLITAVEALLDRKDKRQSIRQAGGALAARLLPDKTYQGKRPEEFFGLCYSVRSSILHSGKIPSNISDFTSLYAAAHEFVCDLLIKSLEEAG